MKHLGSHHSPSSLRILLSWVCYVSCNYANQLSSFQNFNLSPLLLSGSFLQVLGEKLNVQIYISIHLLCPFFLPSFSPVTCPHSASSFLCSIFISILLPLGSRMIKVEESSESIWLSPLILQMVSLRPKENGSPSTYHTATALTFFATLALQVVSHDC